MADEQLPLWPGEEPQAILSNNPVSKPVDPIISAVDTQRLEGFNLIIHKMESAFNGITDSVGKLLNELGAAKLAQKEITGDAREQLMARERLNKLAQEQLRVQERLNKLQGIATTKADEEATSSKKTLQTAEARAKALDREMRLYGLYDKQRKRFVIDEKDYTSKEMGDILSGDPKSEEYQRMVAALEHKMIHTKVDPKGGDAHARLGELLGRVARGDVGGALAEASQTIRGTDRAAAGIEKWMERRAAGGVIQRGAGTLLGGVGMRLMTPGGVAAGIYAGKQIIDTVSGAIQGSTRIGQATGEGMAAGREAVSQSFNPFGSRGWDALNPFDMVSNKQALQINKGLRAQGFRGESAGDAMNAVIDIVKDVGIEWQDAVGMASTATREGGLSLSEFRAQMKDLDDAARAGSVSLDNIVSNFKQLQTWSIAQGADTAKLAEPVTAALQKQFAGSTIANRKDGLLGQVATAGLPALAMRYGVPITEIGSPETAKRIGEFLDKFLGDYIDMKHERFPGWSVERFARFIMATQGPIIERFLPGVDAGLLAGMLKTTMRNRKQGNTNFAGEVTQKAVEQGFDPAKDKAKDKADDFDPLKYHQGALNASMSPMDRNILERNIKGGGKERLREKETIKGIRRLLTDQGVSKADIDKIVAPLNEAVVPIDRNWRTGRDNFNDAVEAAKKEAMEVVVRVHPDSKRALQADTAWIRHTQGKQGSQGMYRP